METNNLSPEASLQVIETMLRKTSQRISNLGASQFLIWGYTTILVSILVFFLEPAMQGNVHYLWMLIPVIGGILSWLTGKKEAQAPYSRSQVDRLMQVVWTVIGVNVLISSFLFGVLSLLVVALMIGSATAITGFALRIRPLQVCSVLGLGMLYLYFILVQYIGLQIEHRYIYLVFAGIFFIINCIPGHYLYAAARKAKQSNPSKA